MWTLLQRKPIASIQSPLLFVELIKRTRIVVIDDVATEFPFEFFRRQGYAVDHWPDVQDMAKLETGFYDIIILDIGGVGKDLDPKHEGAGVLRHIKHVNPSQVVVAFSGQSHESSRIEFFRAADQYVAKPATVLIWKENIDALIKTTVTVTHYWGTLRTLLTAQGVAPSKIDKLEQGVVRAVTKGSANPAELIKTHLGAIENAVTVLSILKKLLAIAVA